MVYLFFDIIFYFLYVIWLADELPLLLLVGRSFEGRGQDWGEAGCHHQTHQHPAEGDHTALGPRHLRGEH